MNPKQVWIRDDLMKRRNRAFSLVELIIVVVVIGVLTGIYMLIAGRSDESVKKNACASNRETIMAAWRVYKFANPKYGDGLQGFIDAKGYDQVVPDSMVCPSGGDYTAADDESSVHCSEHND